MHNKSAPLPYHEYASFLLRLRQKRNDQEELWIASLQSTATGESLSFPNMEAFIHFLQTHFVTGNTQEHANPHGKPLATEQTHQGSEQ